MVSLEKKPAEFRRLFGSGPAGMVISIVLFVIAAWLSRQISLPHLSDNRYLLDSLFVIACLITLGIIIWSFRSLPAADRGNRLCTSGAFRYVRHPLYAAFLSVFNFGLAVYLNSYIMVIWAVLLHPLWHYIVQDEERMMIDLFGEEYIQYRKKTGRFFPRLVITRD